MSAKSNLASSRPTAKSNYRASQLVKKWSRNRDRPAAESLEVERLKTNLGHLVTRLSVGGKKQACEQIAEKLSALAGLSNGHVWGWKYVAAVSAGSLSPSAKFMRAFHLYSLHLNPRQRQWFYFAWKNRDVAAFHARSILREMIHTHMKALGYKPVTFTRYMEIKKRRTM